MTSKTEIISNGSKTLGQAPDSINQLLGVLTSETLNPMFEEYGNFAYIHENKTTFFGNLHSVSHGFNIRSTDKKIIAKLTKAIRANQKTDAYKKARAQMTIKQGYTDRTGPGYNPT